MLDETIAQLLDEAGDLADGKLQLGPVIEQIQAAFDARSIANVVTRVRAIDISVPDAQWQAIRAELRSRRVGTPDRRDEALKALGRAVQNDDQSEFWRALLLLGIIVRDSMPHLDNAFQEPGERELPMP